MNMFKRGRKAKEEEEVHGGSQHTKTSRSLPRVKKGKKEVEVKPVLDLKTALPDTQEFRTSLLMPNLSARFSMLREQDDPRTKIGKAADDSVLFPKRASRLNLFGHNPLTDIAEVESIQSSIRPPFADDKHGSVYSDGSDDAGSMMGRTRPGEGNNLFGGRQKLYKIPTAGATGSDGTSMVGGKHMYQNDVSMSAFQQYRLKNRERQGSEEGHDRNSLENNDSEDNELNRTSSASFSQNRGTQSSTNSGPRRTSTAATSVNSESPVPRKGSNAAVAKFREQEANSSAESVGFSVSPSFRKRREDGSRPTYRLSQSKSAANLRENGSRPSPVFTPSAYRTMSPPPSSASQPLDFNLRPESRSQRPDSRSQVSRFQTASPTSEPEEDDFATFNRSIQPNDRGKATAMGLFNKPQRHFDEQQYTQRQLQMHEGRNSPHSPEPQGQLQQNSASIETLSGPVTPDPTYKPMPPLPTQSSQPVEARSNPANDSKKKANRKRAVSKPTLANKEVSMKARVEEMIKRQNAELAAMEAAQLGPSRPFDDEPKLNEIEVPTKPEPQLMAPNDVHPALRGFNFDNEAPEPFAIRPRVEHVDSPTLGPIAGLGLSGMIKTHLRHDSDKSSIYPPLSPAIPQFNQDEVRNGPSNSTGKIGGENGRHEYYGADQNLYQSSRSQPEQFSPPLPSNAMSDKAHQILGLDTSHRGANSGVATLSSSNRDEDRTGGGPENLQQNMDSVSHHRNISTETTKEQRRFDADLAERRRRIQEGLKGNNDKWQPVERSFALPRMGPKSSERNFDSQAKAMRTLGISSSDRDRDMPPPRLIQRPTTSQDNYQTARYPAYPRNPQYARHAPTDLQDRQMPPRATTPSGNPVVRDRSNSAAGDRSVSRNRQYTDDTEPMPLLYNRAPSSMSPPHRDPRRVAASPDENRRYDRSASAMAGSYRERPGYFNSKPSGPHEMPNSFNPRPSPRPVPNANPGSYDSASSIPMQHSSSPGVSGGFSPTNGRATPIIPGRASAAGHRKRSVTKGMISEPTFVSSTSQIELAQLSQSDDPMNSPPLPTMNPRRRAPTIENIQGSVGPHPAMRQDMSHSTAMTGPGMSDGMRSPPPRQRNRLRKTSSEGGNLAAKARLQVLMAEIARERERTPQMFPNRSATALGMTHDGGMF